MIVLFSELNIVEVEKRDFVLKASVIIGESGVDLGRIGDIRSVVDITRGRFVGQDFGVGRGLKTEL